jgi:hypothetical protein
MTPLRSLPPRTTRQLPRKAFREYLDIMYNVLMNIIMDASAIIAMVIDEPERV